MVFVTCLCLMGLRLPIVTAGSEFVNCGPVSRVVSELVRTGDLPAGSRVSLELANRTTFLRLSESGRKSAALVLSRLFDAEWTPTKDGPVLGSKVEAIEERRGEERAVLASAIDHSIRLSLRGVQLPANEAQMKDFARNWTSSVRLFLQRSSADSIPAPFSPLDITLKQIAADLAGKYFASLPIMRTVTFATMPCGQQKAFPKGTKAVERYAMMMSAPGVLSAWNDLRRRAKQPWVVPDLLQEPRIDLVVSVACTSREIRLTGRCYSNDGSKFDEAELSIPIEVDNSISLQQADREIWDRAEPTSSEVRQLARIARGPFPILEKTELPSGLQQIASDPATYEPWQPYLSLVLGRLKLNDGLSSVAAIVDDTWFDYWSKTLVAESVAPAALLISSKLPSALKVWEQDGAVFLKPRLSLLRKDIDSPRTILAAYARRIRAEGFESIDKYCDAVHGIRLASIGGIFAGFRRLLEASGLSMLGRTPSFWAGRFCGSVSHPLVPEKVQSLSFKGSGMTAEQFDLYREWIQSNWFDFVGAGPSVSNLEADGTSFTTDEISNSVLSVYHSQYSGYVPARISGSAIQPSLNTLSREELAAYLAQGWNMQFQGDEKLMLDCALFSTQAQEWAASIDLEKRAHFDDVLGKVRTSLSSSPSRLGDLGDELLKWLLPEVRRRIGFACSY